MDNLFKKITIHSNKLNKDIELECYTNADNETIISTNSLKAFFEQIKSDLGITDSVKSDLVYNEKGTITYASVEWRLKDKAGYDSTFVGEASIFNTESIISKKYPKITALNRAQSIGIITYLQLPGKVFSDSQEISSENNKTATIETSQGEVKVLNLKAAKPEVVTENQPPIVNNETDTSVSKINDMVPSNIPQGVISSIPEMPTEAELEAQLPFNNLGPNIDNNNKNISENTITSNINDNNTTEENTEISNNFNDSNNKKVIEGIDENTLVGIGKYMNTSIKDLISLKNNGDELAVKFINLIKSGKMIQTNPEIIKVFEYIKANA